MATGSAKGFWEGNRADPACANLYLSAKLLPPLIEDTAGIRETRSMDTWAWESRDHRVQTPLASPSPHCSKQGQWPRNMPRCLLEVSKFENTTNSMGNFIQCLAIHTGKKIVFTFEWDFLNFKLSSYSLF